MDISNILARARGLFVSGEQLEGRTLESDIDRGNRLYEAALASNASVSDLVKEDQAWRRISSLAEQTQLSEHEQGLMIKLADWFAENSPLGRKMIRTTASHLVGANLDFTAQPDILNERLHEFAGDPVNRLVQDLPKICRQWLIHGELFLPVFAGAASGRMSVGFLHPAQIRTVKTDPENARIFTEALERRPAGEDDKGWLVLNGGAYTDEDIPRLIQDDQAPTLLYFPLQMGMVGRGRAYLSTLFYWLHRTEQFLNDRLMVNNFSKAWLWDVAVEGTSADVEKIARQIEGRGPVPGSVKVHSTAETWEPKSVALHAADANNDFLAVLKYSALGCGLPEHWVGASADVNRSTADSASEPAIRDLETLQAEFVGLYETILRTQALLFVGARTLASPEFDITIQPPDLSRSDNVAVADATQKMVQATDAAVNARMMTVDTARTLIHNAAGAEMPDDIEEQIKTDIEQDVLGVYGSVQPPPVPGQEPQGNPAQPGAQEPDQGNPPPANTPPREEQ